MDRTLALDEPDHLRHRVFRWDRDHHVHVIGHQMAFFDPAFLLLRQLAEHLPQMPPQLRIQRLPAALGNEDDMVFALPFACGLGSRSSSIDETSFRVLGGSQLEVFVDGRLPEMSNFYCLPGRAGGSPGLC